MSARLNEHLAPTESVELRFEPDEVESLEENTGGEKENVLAATDRRFLFLNGDTFRDIDYSSISSIDIETETYERSYLFIAPIIPGILLLVLGLLPEIPTIGSLPLVAKVGLIAGGVLLLSAGGVLFYSFMQTEPRTERILTLTLQSGDEFTFEFPPSEDMMRRLRRLSKVMREYETYRVIPAE